MNDRFSSFILAGILTIIMNSAIQASQSIQMTDSVPSYLTAKTGEESANILPVRYHHWRGHWWGEPIIVEPACTEVCTHWGCHWVCDD